MSPAIADNDAEAASAATATILRILFDIASSFIVVDGAEYNRAFERLL
jgi:hypothetical protein